MTQVAATEFAVTTDDLKVCLEDFRARFNSHPRIAKLCKKWDRRILFETTDAEELFTCTIDPPEMGEIEVGGYFDDEDENQVHIRGTREVLIEIFSFTYNPTTAILDGTLEVFSNDKDKIKLEAISFTLWDHIPQTS